VALGVFALFFVGYAAVILWRADFSDFDHNILLEPILSGRDSRPPIWPTQGRFFPLAHLEFDVLRRISPTPPFYHGFAIAQLALLVAFLFLVLRDLSLKARCLAVALAMIAPAVLIAFSGLVYPERNGLLLIAVLLFAVQRIPERTGNGFLVLALVAVHLGIYYKETTFLLVLGFAGGRLWIARQASPSTPRSLRRMLRENPLEAGMILLAGVFVALYTGTMLGYRSVRYATAHPGNLGPIDAFAEYLRNDPLLLILLVVFVVRAVRILRRSIPPDPLWDPIALGGLCYFAGYVGLGLRTSYYLSPVDLIAVLYLAERTRAAVAARAIPAHAPWVAAGLGAISLAAVSGLVTLRARNAVHGKAQLAEFLRRTADTATVPPRLWFPRTPPYRLWQLATYLEYKGVRVVSDSAPGGDGPRVMFESPAEFTRARCASFREYPCSHVASPRPGSLVVVLPDDELAGDAPGTMQPDVPVLFGYRPFGPGHPFYAWMRRTAALQAPGSRGLTSRTDPWAAYVWAP
jgi:hypothetical protein